jgi:hypothetical protein
MSKSTIGKLVTGLAFLILFVIMIANNLFRAFDSMPFGDWSVFIGFIVVWAIVHFIMTRYGYFDWYYDRKK